MWPRFTDMQDNGFEGYQITPRFATRVYYNWYALLTTAPEQSL